MEVLNQEIKADAGKPQLCLVPQQIIYDIAEVRAYGVMKYRTANSWQEVEIDRYRNAAFRHFLAYLKNPTGRDQESGIKHYKHLACNAAFICELEAMKEAICTDEIIEKHKQKTCDHEWLVNVSECSEAVAVLKCKKCGKKIKRLNEVGK